MTSNPEPKSFTAGEFVSWRCYEVLYHANNGWRLVYNFRSSVENSNIDVTSVADGAYHVVTLTSELTKDYKAGNYWWQCWARKNEKHYIVRHGNLVIKPSLAELEVFDGRSHVKKMLEALEAMLLGKASLD
jgi:hypothetical protein